MISPKPVVMDSMVFSTPSPVARPRYAEPMTSDTTGLNLNRTIITTTARMATVVLAMIPISDIGLIRFAGV
jgi:hypothetical protein